MDDFGLPFDNRIGHQGLFFDRYDAEPYAAPTLVSFTQDPKGLYYNRNRHYSASSGRFVQRDPNQTAIPLIQSLAFGGSSFEPGIGAFGPGILYEDGLHLYVRVAGDPVNRTDAIGLAAQPPSSSEIIMMRDFEAIWDSIVGTGSAYLGVQGGATFGAFWGGNVTVLPKGAVAAASISEGVSQFADFYAEQLIYLPVDVALGGSASVGRIARVGSTARRVGVAARSGRYLSASSGAVGFAAKSRGFRSFSAFKRAMGLAGPGRVWHHLVEQNRVVQFAAKTIHSVKNVVSIPRKVNQKIADYYSSKRWFTNGKTVRAWLRGKPFKEQFEFALKTLRKFGG